MTLFIAVFFVGTVFGAAAYRIFGQHDGGSGSGYHFVYPFYPGVRID